MRNAQRGNWDEFARELVDALTKVEVFFKKNQLQKDIVEYETLKQQVTDAENAYLNSNHNNRTQLRIALTSSQGKLRSTVNPERCTVKAYLIINKINLHQLYSKVTFFLNQKTNTKVSFKKILVKFNAELKKPLNQLQGFAGILADLERLRLKEQKRLAVLQEEKTSSVQRPNLQIDTKLDDLLSGLESPSLLLPDDALNSPLASPSPWTPLSSRSQRSDSVASLPDQLFSHEFKSGDQSPEPQTSPPRPQTSTTEVETQAAVEHAIKWAVVMTQLKSYHQNKGIFRKLSAGIANTCLLNCFWWGKDRAGMTKSISELQQFVKGKQGESDIKEADQSNLNRIVEGRGLRQRMEGCGASLFHWRYNNGETSNVLEAITEAISAPAA